MNLINLESHVDERILNRGYGYYEDGLVISLKETDENVYMSKVEGTDV